MWFIVSAIAVLMAVLAGVSIVLIMNYRFNVAIDNNAIISNNRIVSTASERIDRYLTEVVQASKPFAENTDVFPTMSDIISNTYILIPEHIDTIAIFTDSGERKIITNSQILYPPEELTAQGWFRAVAPGSRLFSVSSPHIQRLFPGVYPWVVSISVGMSWESDGLPQRGVMLIDLTLDFIRDICSGMMNENLYLYIIDDEGRIVYHPRQQMINVGIHRENTLQIARTIMNETDMVVRDGTDMVVRDGTGMVASDGTGMVASDGTGMVVNEGGERLFVKTVGMNNARWRVVGVSSLKGILSYDSDMPVFIWIIIASILLIVFVLAFLISFAVTKPLHRLMSGMQSVESGEWDIFVEKRGVFEVVALSSAFSHMVDRIKALMGRIMDDQKALRESEIRMLHEQINPHFLYNTLDSMVWLAESGNKESVVKMIETLAEFFRLTLHEGNETIPVRDEIKHVESYLTIQKMRFGKTFDFDIEMDPAAEGFLSMKMILQPLAENAIIHGIGRTGEGGLISIRACMGSDNSIVYEVKDNGMGMTSEILERVKKNEPSGNSGIGIRNISQRINLYYGDGYGLAFESEPEEGTKVSVRIPAVPASASSYDKKGVSE